MRPGPALVLVLVSLSGAHADDNGFAGAWMLEVRIPAEPLVGLLELERHGENWTAWVEGGPAPVTIDGNRIELLVDSRDRQGFLFKRRLTGVLEGNAMSGSMRSTTPRASSLYSYGSPALAHEVNRAT